MLLTPARRATPYLSPHVTNDSAVAERPKIHKLRYELASRIVGLNFCGTRMPFTRMITLLKAALSILGTESGTELAKAV